MDRKLVRAFWEAYAIGDAYGKATEYCSLDEIKNCYSTIDRILGPEESLSHKDLLKGKVTDDTEQNIYLIKAYSKTRFVSAKITADALVSWINETDAMKYIGPSSLRALNAMKKGVPPEEAGKNGTTCGGIMRVPAAVFFSDDKTLINNVVECLKPTHFTSLAIEAALSYAFALRCALKNSSVEEILEEAKRGAREGRQYGCRERTQGVGPKVDSRIAFLEKIIKEIKNENELKDLLYSVLGTTLSSQDVASAVYGLFLYCKEDTALIIRLATELGGDTDTIACLAAGLSALYGKGHNIKRDEIKLVEEANGINFESLTSLILGE